MALATGADEPWSLRRVRRLQQNAPDDRQLILAEARRLTRKRRPDAVRQLLDTNSRPASPDPNLFALWLEASGATEAEDWAMLRGAQESARLWLLLARLMESDDLSLACDSAEKAIRLAPHDPEACRLMARLLSTADRSQEAQHFITQAERQEELNTLCGNRDVFGTSRAERCVQLLREQGRHMEAVAWCRQEQQSFPQSEWPQSVLAELSQGHLPYQAASPKHDGKSTRPPETLSIAVALERLIQNKGQGDPHSETSNHRITSFSALQFKDVASDTGLNVAFYNGANATDSGRYMHEFTGGGVGVLDIDGDDWPDLMFAQGADDPRENHTSPTVPTDRLFRNLRGSAFVDVSDVAGIDEHEFGQGVATGDVNNDGFDDIYVANTSHNALWINQGDGTFVRQTQPSGSSVWTISAMVADINLDSIPDLYDVNYVGGDDVFTQLCDHEGLSRVCGPTDFPAEPDAFRAGEGDGRFSERAAEAGLSAPDGRGMGVVAGDLLRTGRMQVLIANDESANHFYELNEDGVFVDTARRRGLATGSLGSAQGCMGIAVGHVGSRQRCDLFITNYYGESNCLHRQTADGFFPDLIAASRLDHPGRSMLGFGTQFLDIDLDGDDDLFVANGHLDDFQHLHIPYRMKSQIFENRDGRFYESDSSTSAWQATPVLGRAVATLDWNRDGRTDLCVTHLDHPAALLQNDTPPQQPAILLSYIGTGRSRDAVGATIVVTCAQAAEPIVLPIVAGDGYECSSQRLLSVVVPAGGESVRVDDGLTTVTISVDTERPQLYRIVEGRPQAWRIPR